MPSLKKPSVTQGNPNPVATAQSPAQPTRMANTQGNGSGRPLLYPTPKAHYYCGETPFTEAIARQMVGWVEETPEKKFEGDYLLTDYNKKKVRCMNSVDNRPFDMGLAEHWCSEILYGHWQFNHEAMIIGQYGNCLEGNHRGVGLILAVQEWKLHSERYPFWENREPVIECLVSMGCSEDPHVVDTINTGKPRSFQDVLYRGQYFRKGSDGKTNMAASDRKQCIRILDYAIRMLWSRTGAMASAFSPKRSHADSMDFIRRHPKIFEYVTHIFEENGDDGMVARYISPGYATGLLYLMCSCKSDPTEYRKAQSGGDESLLNFEAEDLAMDFWTHLAQSDAKLKIVLTTITSPSFGEGGASRSERIATIIKAWMATLAGAKVTPPALQLEYKEGTSGKELVSNPTIGGIDLGPKPSTEDLEASTDPSAAEIAETKAQLNQERAQKKGRQKVAIEGQQVWVEEDGGHWEGKVNEIYVAPTGKVAKVADKKGKVFEVPLADCLTANPNAAG